MDFDLYFVDDDRGGDTSNVNNDDSKSVKGVRKKFATPPVKVACLEWQVKLD